MTDIPDAATSLEVLAKRYQDNFATGRSAFQWWHQTDAFGAKTTVTRRGRRRRDPHITEEILVRHRFTNTMASAYRDLTRARSEVDALTLKADSRLVGQVDAAITHFHQVGKELEGLGRDAYDSRHHPRHEAALVLAAKVLALVDLAKERDLALNLIDPASLEQVACDLRADINLVRDMVSVDKIDAALEAAAKERPEHVARSTARPV